MTIYGEIKDIIKGNRGDRLDMMIPLLLATVSTLADARWEWIGAPSITVFLGVFGSIYAVWRVVAICVKKLTGEWYRERFTEFVRAEPMPLRRAGLRALREVQMHKGKSDRLIYLIARRLKDESSISPGGDYHYHGGLGLRIKWDRSRFQIVPHDELVAAEEGVRSLPRKEEEHDG